MKVVLHFKEKQWEFIAAIRYRRGVKFNAPTAVYKERTKDMRERGFTLIELMITVAILAILAAVAIPVYNNYVYKSKTAEATTNISGIRTLQESWFAENNTYNIVCCAAAPAAGTLGKQRLTWVAGDLASWNPLGFAPTGSATYYRYAVLSTAATTRLTIGALGDLDGVGGTHIFVMPIGTTVVGTDNTILGVTVTFTTTSSGTIIEGGAGVF